MMRYLKNAAIPEREAAQEIRWGESWMTGHFVEELIHRFEVEQQKTTAVASMR